MINVTYKSTNLCLQLINLLEKKKKKAILQKDEKKNVIY